MRQKLSALLFAAATFVSAQAVTPASAIPAGPLDTINVGPFVIEEYGGFYNFINNSSNLYVWAFAVSNPTAAFISPFTDYKNWASQSANMNFGAGNEPSFAYYSQDADVSDIQNPTLTVVQLANYIAPGETSSQFYHIAAASDAGVLAIDSAGNYYQFSSLSQTPLPAALPLFAGGASVMALVMRRKRKAKLA